MTEFRCTTLSRFARSDGAIVGVVGADASKVEKGAAAYC